MIPKFKSEGIYHLNRGLVHMVVNNQKRDRSNNELTGKHVIIDDVEYLCIAVESFLTPEILEGDSMGLLVEEL